MSGESEPGDIRGRVNVKGPRGFCGNPQVLREAVEKVVSLQNEVMKVIYEVPGLSDRERKGTADYLDGFFEKARDTDEMFEKFERRCIEQ